MLSIPRNSTEQYGYDSESSQPPGRKEVTIRVWFNTFQKELRKKERRKEGTPNGSIRHCTDLRTSIQDMKFRGTRSENKLAK